MGYLPPLSEMNTSRDMVSEFGGYNHNLRIGANEYFDMQNMSSTLYPVLSPRNRRGKIRSFTKPNGLFAHESLCWVDGTEFYYGNARVEGFHLSDSAKAFVKMGAYILIWPDAKYYNTVDGSFGGLGNAVTTSSPVSVALCKLDGTPYSGYTHSNTVPASPADGQLWIDTSNTPHVLKQYSDTYGTWASVPTTYVMISCPGIGIGFSDYDGVAISGLKNDLLNGSFILYSVSADHIVIPAIIDALFEQSDSVTIERKIPLMDYVTESENRVWGCSSATNEIFACKLGDPKNWNSFLGISTDSYALTVGSSGDFTGACTHLGYVLFFKDNVIHKIYGNKPSNFQLTNTSCRGVEKGSERSLVIVNETLYYKSKHDVCAYNSSLPASVSAALGTVSYKNAVAGALGSKYYICLEKDDGAHAMFVFDSVRGLWHKEDGVNATYFAAIGKELYFIDTNDGYMYSVGGTISDYSEGDSALEPAVKWFAESGELGLESPDRKYISKFQFRMDLPSGSEIKIELEYDNSGIWIEKYRVAITDQRSFTVPIIPIRCNTIKYRLSGKGSCNTFSITKTIEKGSEL